MKKIRNRFQIHLSTCVIVMGVLGILLRENVAVRHSAWYVPEVGSLRDEVLADVAAGNYDIRGWPFLFQFKATRNATGSSVEFGFRPELICFNIIICLAILVAVAVFLEFWIIIWSRRIQGNVDEKSEPDSGKRD